MATTPSIIPDSQATKFLQQQQQQNIATSVQDPPPTDPPGTPTQEPVRQVVKDYPDDWKQLLERARKEEKDKLYDRIKRAEAVESEVTTLRARCAELDQRASQAEKELQEATKKKQKQKQDPDGGIDFDVHALIQDTAAATRKELSALFQQEKTQLVGKIAELESKLQHQSLQSLRDRLIAEANGEIIPELVRGNTEQELRESVIESKTAYARAIKNVGIDGSTRPGSTGPSATPPVQPSQPLAVQPLPGSSPATSGGADSVPALTEEIKFADDVKKMSREEYAKHRGTVMSKLRQLYPKQQNPILRR